MVIIGLVVCAFKILAENIDISPNNLLVINNRRIGSESGATFFLTGYKTNVILL
jgi:hypothetical protein